MRSKDKLLVLQSIEIDISEDCILGN